MFDKKLALFALFVVLALVIAACAPASTPTPLPPTRAPTAASTAPPAAPATTAPTALPPSPTKAPEAAKKGGRVVFSDCCEQANLDVHKTGGMGAENVGLAVVSTLVYQNPESGDFEPYLAASWETSPDGLTWTFKLRKDVIFHDGTPFNAQVVKRNFDRIMDPKVASARGASGLGGKLLKSVEVVDDFTIKLVYTQPFAPLLAGLIHTSTGILAPSALDKYGTGVVEQLVGTGPFRFKEWTKGQDTILVPFDKFNWAPKSWGNSGAPLLDEFRWRPVGEVTTRMVALERDEIQMARVPWSEYKRVKDAGFPIVQLNNPGIGLSIFLNPTRPPLDDKRVRLAVAYGMDREGVIKAPFLGSATWAEYTPLTKGLLGYDPDLAKRVGVLYDPTKAKALLDEAGWKPGSDGIRMKDGQKLSLGLYISAADKDPAEITQLLLKQVGIGVDIKVLDSAAFNNAISGGEQHLHLAAWSSSDPDLLFQVFHSSEIGGNNRSRVNNKELDGLLEKGRTTVDQSKRMPLYVKAQEILLSEGYLVPLYNSNRTFAYAKLVKGVQFNSYPWPISSGLWLQK